MQQKVNTTIQALFVFISHSPFLFAATQTAKAMLVSFGLQGDGGQGNPVFTLGRVQSCLTSSIPASSCLSIAAAVAAVCKLLVSPTPSCSAEGS